VDQVVGRPETETCAKWTLGGVLRTGALLAAAAFASLFAVDLPLPAASGAGQPGVSQAFVPASDKWIELGAPQRPATTPTLRSGSTRLQADLTQRSAAVDPVAFPGRTPERRQLRRKPRGVPQGVQVGGRGRQVARSAVARRAPGSA